MNIDNINLTAFIGVAEAGSFNKAAEAMLITSTALIKQINQLEGDLGLRLFNRSHRGLTMTKAGESLYKDAKYIIGYCHNAIEKARNAELNENQIIRIGTSPIMPAQMLMELWPRIHALCQELNFKLVPFENTVENAREILKNLGENIDIVTGFVDEKLMEQRGCSGLAIKREPLCCAVSIYDPLAAKDKLTVEDLYGRNLMMIRRGWCEHMDALRDEITNHPNINIIDFELYDVGVFNLCEQNRDVLVSIKSWDIVHPMMKVIPVEWDYAMPIGIMHASKPSEVVDLFLKAARKIMDE